MFLESNKNVIRESIDIQKKMLNENMVTSVE